MSELQRIVDSLARTTRRAVSIHDRGRRLLAFSSHEGPVDTVRRESILTRKGPARGFAWAKEFGIETVGEPVRIPENRDLDMDARICAPVRFDGRLLGFLWLVDPDESLGAEVMDLISSSADAAALAIQQEELVAELDRGRERELLRDLLSEQTDVRLHAVDELIETGVLVPSDSVVAIVVRPTSGGSPMTPSHTAIRSRVERALDRVRLRVAPRQGLQLVRPDHGVILVTVARHQLGSLDALGIDLHAFVDEALHDPAWKVVVGIGEPHGSVADAHVSYAQARKVAEVCGVLNPAGPVTKWSDLGVYRTLLQLPLSEVSMRSLHPGLAKLFDVRESAMWLQTLECFLDLGCDARKAAGVLNVNRSSLYHRIHRIEQIAGVDLESGDDRLALHLGLKLARLGGLLSE